MSDIPVLFLVFNRPEHTRTVLAQIRAHAPARLYVHCDGPRSDRPDDAAKVAQVRDIVNSGIDWNCELSVFYRPENVGLRDGVHGAIDWFFTNEERGVILEDDCVPDPSLFRFCAELLERYADDQQVMHIGCSNVANYRRSNQSADYVFSRFSFVYGWATWRRAWQKMSLALDGLNEFEKSGRIADLVPDPLAQAYMLDKFQVTQRKENKSWAYAWFYSILNAGGICVVPSVNLVQNIGFNEPDATNTAGFDVRARVRSQSLTFPLRHPADRTIYPALEMRFFHTSQKSWARLWLRSLLRWGRKSASSYWRKSLLSFTIQTLQSAPNFTHIKQSFSYRRRWIQSMQPGRNSVADESAWLTFPAVDCLANWLRPEHKVFEYGGGGSTLFFCKRAGFVATVEHDRDWFNVLCNQVQEKGYENWAGHYVNPKAATRSAYSSDAKGFENHCFEAYVRAIQNYPLQHFDVILVDGRARSSCIAQCLPYLKPGGLLVVDNVERARYWPAISKVVNGPFVPVVSGHYPTLYAPDFTNTLILQQKTR